MTKAYWLGRLEVSVTGHQQVYVDFGFVYDSALQAGQMLSQSGDLAAQIEARISGYLVVARTTGMEFAGHAPDQFAQPPLDGGVDVFVARLYDELPISQLGVYPSESLQQCIAFFLVNDAGASQRLGISDAGHDVGFPKPYVKADRVTKAVHYFTGAVGEASTPECGHSEVPLNFPGQKLVLIEEMSFSTRSS
jgi:hypothetical protein